MKTRLPGHAPAGPAMSAPRLGAPRLAGLALVGLVALGGAAALAQAEADRRLDAAIARLRSALGPEVRLEIGRRQVDPVTGQAVLADVTLVDGARRLTVPEVRLTEVSDARIGRAELLRPRVEEGKDTSGEAARVLLSGMPLPPPGGALDLATLAFDAVEVEALRMDDPAHGAIRLGRLALRDMRPDATGTGLGAGTVEGFDYRGAGADAPAFRIGRAAVEAVVLPVTLGAFDPTAFRAGRLALEGAALRDPGSSVNLSLGRLAVQDWVPGRLTELAVEGLELAAPAGPVGAGEMRLGRLAATGMDGAGMLQAVLAGRQVPEPRPGVTQRVALEGLDLRGDGQPLLAVGRLAAEGAAEGDTLRGGLTLEGFRFTAPPGQAGWLRDLGYAEVAGGIHSRASAARAGGRLEVAPFAITWQDAGALSVTARVDGMPAAPEPGTKIDQDATLAGLAEGRVEELVVTWQEPGCSAASSPSRRASSGCRRRGCASNGPRWRWPCRCRAPRPRPAAARPPPRTPRPTPSPRSGRRWPTSSAGPARSRSRCGRRSRSPSASWRAWPARSRRRRCSGSASASSRAERSRERTRLIPALPAATQAGKARESEMAMDGGAKAGSVAPTPWPWWIQARQWDRLMQMARIGAIPGDGVNRACLTDLDREARRLLLSWGKSLGLKASVDALGNLFLRHEGTERGLAPVLTGSHMDTQPNGGRFDGIWGVIAGLEAVQALREAGVATRRPIEVVAWTNEEGGRFAPGCMGSMAYAGFKPAGAWDLVADNEGVTFGDALREHLALEADIPRRPLGVVEGPAPFAYVEAHIEQGPRLEAEGLDIGVVEGIQGSRWFLVEIAGKTDHAGTTPLSLRKDAVQDMLRAVAALNALMADPTDVLRFTVGRIEVHPNTSNSVADRVRFTIDFRHPDKAVLLERGDAIERVVRDAMTTCTATVTERFHALPAAFDPLVPAVVERAAKAQGLKALRMPSGAFHDAQFMVPICPTGMIFVPCRGGVSHHPSEYSEPAQLATGARVLAAVLAELANG
jgi:N-carbamoyl-L-amino-acid hydrolase